MLYEVITSLSMPQSNQYDDGYFGPSGWRTCGTSLHRLLQWSRPNSTNLLGHIYLVVRSKWTCPPGRWPCRVGQCRPISVAKPMGIGAPWEEKNQLRSLFVLLQKMQGKEK